MQTDEDKYRMKISVIKHRRTR